MVDREKTIIAAARGLILDEETAAAQPSRTALSEDRTILANERTFAGWMRTSLACLAIGVGSHALARELEPWWLPPLIATAFLLLAAIVMVLAERRATAVMKRLSAHIVVTAKPLNLRLFTTVICIAAAAIAVGLWVIDFR